jgi:hypothetical protein
MWLATESLDAVAAGGVAWAFEERSEDVAPARASPQSGQKLK